MTVIRLHDEEYVTKWYSCSIPLHIIGPNYNQNELVNLAHNYITLLPVVNHYSFKTKTNKPIYVVYVEGRAVSPFLTHLSI